MNENRKSLVTRVKAFPRPLWVLFFGTFLNKFGTFVIPFLALYMTGRGFSLAQAGMAISAYGFGNLLASALGGHLADTFGRRNTIVFSMFSAAVSMMLLSQANTFGSILAMTALVGLTGELYRPASSALLSDLVPAGERVTAYSTYRLAFNAGWAFGPATAGFLAGHSFFWLFVGDAATSVLFGIVAWVALPQGKRAAKSSQGWKPALSVIKRDWPFLRLLAASLVISLVSLQMSSTFGLQVTGQGFSAATYGALISFNGVLVVFCELPISNIAQRFSPRRIMALGYALIGIGFTLNAFARTLPMLVLVIFIFTLGEMTTSPVSAAYVADLAPVEYRGRYMGVAGLTSAFALLFAPNLGITIFGVHPFALWISCAALGLIAAGIILGGKDKNRMKLYKSSKQFTE